MYSASGSNQTGGIARVGRSMEFFCFFSFFSPSTSFFLFFFLFRLSRLFFRPSGLAGTRPLWLHDKPRSQPLLTLFADQGPPDAEQSSDPPVV